MFGKPVVKVHGVSLVGKVVSASRSVKDDLMT